MAELIGDMEWSRGDSYSLTLRLKDKFTAEYIDLTGYTFLFTVNKDKDPIDDTNQLFQIEGTVAPDQVTDKGRVSFKPAISATATADVGGYYYDVQLSYDVDSPRTLFKFKFKIVQDITK